MASPPRASGAGETSKMGDDQKPLSFFNVSTFIVQLCYLHLQLSSFLSDSSCYTSCFWKGPSTARTTRIVGREACHLLTVRSICTFLLSWTNWTCCYYYPFYTCRCIASELSPFSIDISSMVGMFGMVGRLPLEVEEAPLGWEE